MTYNNYLANLNLPNRTPKQSEYIIAYLEIMDGEKLGNSEEVLNLLNKIYNDTLNLHKEMGKGNVEVPSLIKIFCTNILIAMEAGTKDKYPANCYSVAAFAMALQVTALKHGLFINGAMTVGNFVEKDYQHLFVYGASLVNTSTLNKKYNKVLPRIIIDEKIKKNMSWEGVLQNPTFNNILARDTDGRFFLNQFSLLNSSPNTLPCLGKKIFNHFLKTLVNDENSIEKYYFTFYLFNTYCNRIDEYRKLLIPIDYLDQEKENKASLDRESILQKTKIDFTSGDKLKFTDHVIAHIDFLGAKNKMTDPKKSDEFLKEIYQTYMDALELYKKNHNKLTKRFKIKIFSDNIVIAEEIENPKDPKSIEQSYTHVEQFASMIYIIALNTKNTMRGAISKGKLYIDDTFIFGETLFKAVNMEEKQAVYPRIIVNRKIKNEIFKQNDPENIILTDKGGVFYLNPLHGVKKIVPIQLYNQNLGFIQRFLENSLKNPDVQKDDKLYSKYVWLINHFNQYCKENEFNHQIMIK